MAFRCRSRVRVSLILSAAASASSVQAASQTCAANPPSVIATDRPQVTNSSIVVPCGTLQFENGLQLTSEAGQRSLDLPETSIRYGIGKRTEFRAGVPDYFSNADTASGFFAGVSDLSLGLKQQLGPAAGFDVSVIGTVSFPTGGKSLSSHGYDPSVQLPWSRSLPKGWTAAGQLGLMSATQGSRRNLMGQSSVYFDRQVTSLLDAYVEYSGVFPHRGTPQHLIDFGAAYKIGSNQQIDIHSGFGLSSAAADYPIGIGYSVRFQVRQGKVTPPKK